MSTRLAAAALALLLAGAPALAQDTPAQACIAGQGTLEVDRFQLLRRLSLDLRGRLPSYEEYQALEASPGVPLDTVRAFLADDGFRTQMRRYHELFLWPNVGNFNFGDFRQSIGTRTGAPGLLASGRAATYRGASTASCADAEQTAFDPAFPGQFRVPALTPDPVTGLRTEGWRLVEPYWAPGTQVKVCAYDAQETPQVTDPATGRVTRCDRAEGLGNRACGCGPGLRWCVRNETNVKLRSSVREQLGLSVDAAATGKVPYTELVLGRAAFQNGPLAFYERHLAPFNAALGPDPGVLPPERAFTDEAWQPVTRAGTQHAGLLTLPAFLLRFQTQRSRANRLYNAFACEAFTPPTDLVPRAGCSQTSDDLTQRCHCQSCHATLEPLAHHWGQFAEAGTRLMTDPAAFPRVRADCVGRGDAFCRRFYVTDRDDPAKGSHVSFRYVATHPDYLAALEAGPRRAAQALVDRGTFARCTVRRVFGYLVKRDLRAEGEGAEERALLDALAEGFAQSDYHFPTLVERIVALPQYRRVR